MARKGDGKEAKLSYSGNLLVENRNGLIVNAMAWEANGTAERDTALADAGADSGAAAVDGGWGQGLGHGEFRGGVPPHAGDAACRAE